MYKLLYPSIRVRTAPPVSVRVRNRVSVSFSIEQQVISSYWSKWEFCHVKYIVLPQLSEVLPGMPYEPIQGQGHETFKVRNFSIFKIYLLRHFYCELANDHWFWNYGTISKFCTEQIFDICPSFCVTWLRTWKGLRFRRSRPSVLYGPRD